MSGPKTQTELNGPNNGEPVIVDINAWPSYALYRDQAAQAIANHLTERFQRCERCGERVARRSWAVASRNFSRPACARSRFL